MENDLQNVRRVRNGLQLWSRLKASRMGVEDILRIPLNGEYISMMIRIAAETASVPTNSVAITVGFGSAVRPQRYCGALKPEVGHLGFCVTPRHDSIHKCTESLFACRSK